MKKEFVERIEIYQTEHVCKKGSEAQNRMEVYWLLRSTTDRRQRENGIAARHGYADILSGPQNS